MSPPKDPCPHTPGPWSYEASTKTIRSVPANYWLASMNSWDGAVNHEANARLIAAAPDLLAALQKAAWFIENATDETPNRTQLFFEARAAWSAAIAKAVQS